VIQLNHIRLKCVYFAVFLFRTQYELNYHNAWVVMVLCGHWWGQVYVTYKNSHIVSVNASRSIPSRIVLWFWLKYETTVNCSWHLCALYVRAQKVSRAMRTWRWQWPIAEMSCVLITLQPTNKSFRCVFRPSCNYFNRVRPIIAWHFNFVMLDCNKYNTIELFCSHC
jgi:hypothetical protein